MHFTLSQAAKEAKASKSTLSRAINTGRLSADRLEDGSFRIEASELFRVFPKEASLPVASVLEDQRGTGGERSDGELALLRFKAQSLEDQLTRERLLRDQERETSQETMTDLRKRLDRAEERVLALTAQQAAAPDHAEAVPLPASSPPLPKRGMLARLFGRV